MRRYIEVCVQHVESAINAENGGADRLELCGHLELGGVTPSFSQVNEVRKYINIPINMMIRPRCGDFFYNEYEKSMMLEDIAMAKELNLNGIVLGVLDSNGKIDTKFLEKVIMKKGNLEFTFHRAFDEALDQLESLKILMDLNVNTVLTSGGRKNVNEGKSILKDLVDFSMGKIEVMPGRGVTSKNVLDILNTTNVNWIHLTGKTNIESEMKFYNRNLYDENFKYEKTITSWEEIQKVRNLINSLS